MKYILILIFLVSLLSVSALTEEITLFVGESFSFSDRNVTLLAIGEDNIVVCVNNQKGIIDEEEIFNEVDFEIQKLRDDYVELRLKTSCDDCICDESCKNNLCFLYMNEIEDIEEVVEDEEIIEEVECEFNYDCDDGNVNTIDKCIDNKCNYTNIEEGVIVGEEEKTNVIVYMSLFLFLLLVLILVIFLIKKR